MRRLTGLVTLMLCVVLLSGSSLVCAEEIQAVGFYFENEQVKAGDEVIGYVDVNKNDISNGQWTIEYDKERLELVKAERSAGQEDVYVSINANTAGEIIVAFATSGTVKRGHFLDLMFRVKSGLKDGDKININADTEKTYDGSNQAITTTGNTGTNVTQILTVQTSQTSQTESADRERGNNSGETASVGTKNNDSKSLGKETGDDFILLPVIAALLLAGGAAIYVIRRKAGGSDDE